MNAHLTEIRDHQKETWNSFSSGWKKWDTLVVEFLKPMGDEIIRMIAPKNGDVILDVAAGTGEPGLSIAKLIGDGKVIITDLAEGMLVVAREKAAVAGLSNIETVPCDVSNLPFADNTFDAISCRFGFMFFPDLKLASSELYRVLKPGGRIAVAVWSGPLKNPWVTILSGAVANNIEVVTPPPGAPGMFRCAEPGMLVEIFRSAGFTNTKETEVTGRLECGTSDRYWGFMNEAAAPVALVEADETVKAKVRKEVDQILDANYPNGTVAIDSGAYVVYGEK